MSITTTLKTPAPHRYESGYKPGMVVPTKETNILFDELQRAWRRYCFRRKLRRDTREIRQNLKRRQAKEWRYLFNASRQRGPGGS